MIIFLHGLDSFRAGQKVGEIRKKFLAQDSSGSGLSVFDFSGKGGKFSELANALETGNLLAPKRLVVIRNLSLEGSADDQDLASDFLKRQEWLKDDKDIVAVFQEDGKVKKSSGLYKFLEKNAKAQEFEKLAGAKLENWIAKEVANLGASISKKALARLVAYAGDDMHLLSREIQKIVNYAGGKVIGEDDIELMVKANMNSNIFATIDALGGRQKKQALMLLHKHLQGGDDPFYVLSMFVYQFRNLLKIADLHENHGAREAEIARIAKMHPFVIKKSLNQLRNFSFGNLKKAYQKLSILDTAAKTGKIDIRLALDKFIVEL